MGLLRKIVCVSPAKNRAEKEWYDNTGSPYSIYPESNTSPYSIQLSYGDYYSVAIN